MGKKIDAFVLSVLLAAGLFFYFGHVFGNHTAAFILAGACFLLLRRIFGHFSRRFKQNKWVNRRRIHRETGGTIMYFACADVEEAASKLSELIQKAYGQDYPLELVQLHPADSICGEKVFELWKKHRGEERLVICATCKCSQEVRFLTESLKQPRVALVDAPALSALIARYPEGIYMDTPPTQRRRLHIRRVGLLLFNRRNAPRCLVFSVSMLLLYLLGGSYAYLVCSMLLLFVSLASLRKPSTPVKLF